MNCPICGNDSGCGLEAGKRIEACWCYRVSFPEQLKTRVPAELRERACVCRACVEAALQDADPYVDAVASAGKREGRDVI